MTIVNLRLRDYEFKHIIRCVSTIRKEQEEWIYHTRVFTPIQIKEFKANITRLEKLEDKLMTFKKGKGD